MSAPSPSQAAQGMEVCDPEFPNLSRLTEAEMAEFVHLRDALASTRQSLHAANCRLTMLLGKYREWLLGRQLQIGTTKTLRILHEHGTKMKEPNATTEDKERCVAVKRKFRELTSTIFDRNVLLKRGRDLNSAERKRAMKLLNEIS